MMQFDDFEIDQELKDRLSSWRNLPDVHRISETIICPFPVRNSDE